MQRTTASQNVRINMLVIPFVLPIVYVMLNLQSGVARKGADVADVWIYSLVLAVSGRRCIAEDFTLIVLTTFKQMFPFQILILPSIFVIFQILI